MKSASPLLSAAILLTAATTQVSAAPTHNTTAIASYTSTVASHGMPSTISTAAPLSTAITDDQLPCSPGGSGEYQTANGMVVACPSSGSTQNAASRLLWALPVGAAALFYDNGRIWTLPMLAMVVAGYASAGLPGAMAAPVYNTTSLSTLTSTSGYYDGTAYTATTAVVAAASSSAAVDPNKLACTSGGSGSYSGATGAPIICPPSSASPSSSSYSINSRMLSAVGSAVVVVTMGGIETTWTIALLVLSWTANGLPGVMAADMFVSITPEPGPTSPAYTSTTFALLDATSTLSVTMTATTDIINAPKPTSLASTQSFDGATRGMLCAFGSAAIVVGLGGLGVPGSCVLALLLAGCSVAGAPKTMAATTLESLTPTPSLRASSVRAAPTTTLQCADITTPCNLTQVFHPKHVFGAQYICWDGGLEWQCRDSGAFNASDVAQSSASPAEIMSGVLWLISFSAVIALIAVGRLEALALLLLLVGGWIGLGGRAVEVKTPEPDVAITTTTVTMSTTHTTWVIMTAVPIGEPHVPTTSTCGCLISSPTVDNLVLPSAAPIALAATTPDTDLGPLERDDTSVQPPSAVSTAASATLTSSASSTPDPTTACSLVGDLYSCPLSMSSVAVASSAATVLLPRTSLIVGWLMLALAGHFFELSSTAVLIPMLMADMAEAAGTVTSTPLPELAVNVSTTASLTATEVIYIANGAMVPTTTITQFVTPCTPYCASVIDKGHCLLVRGCTDRGGSSTAFIHNESMSKVAAAVFVISMLFGVWVGRMDDGHHRTVTV